MMGISPNLLNFIGRGVVEIDEVFLFSSIKIISNFTLFGNTSGGPPTTYTWTRNGQVITNDASYTIAIQVNQGAGAHFAYSRYRSTLNMTGRLPGVYQYSVTNRATSGIVTNQFIIKGTYHNLVVRKFWYISYNSLKVSFVHCILG